MIFKIGRRYDSSEWAKLTFFAFWFFILGVLFFTLPRLAIPIGVAYVLGLIIEPIIPQLMKLGVNRVIAIVVVFFGFLAITSFPVVKIVPIIKKETENFQYYIPKIERSISKSYLKLRNDIKVRTGIEIGDKGLRDVITYAKEATKEIIFNVPDILKSVLEWILLVPLFLFFYLKDSRTIKQTILRLTPNSIFERFYYLSHQFNKQLSDYIFAKFIEASIVGIIITSGLLIIGVRFSFLLGLIAAVTNIIPYVGPIFGAIPAIVLGLAEYGPGGVFGAMMILYIIANLIDLALVFPILVSKIVDLHPLLVVTSVILGSHFLGVIGMVISIPCVAALKLIFHEIYIEVYSTQQKK